MCAKILGSIAIKKGVKWGAGALLGIFAWGQVSDTGAMIAGAILDTVGQVIFSIWAGLAQIVTFIEELFNIFAGITGIHGQGPMIGLRPGEELPELEQGVSGDGLPMAIINSSTVQAIFYSMMAVATALLVFFTILKLIQNQYKPQGNDTNPYTTVFRMVKGMVMFLFITAAVVVGLQVSGIVLVALRDATSPVGQDTSLAGMAFNAKTANAHRLMRETPDNFTAFHENRIAKMLGKADGGEQYFLVERRPYLDVEPEYIRGSGVIRIPRSGFSLAQNAVNSALENANRWGVSVQGNFLTQNVGIIVQGATLLGHHFFHETANPMNYFHSREVEISRWETDTRSFSETTVTCIETGALLDSWTTPSPWVIFEEMQYRVAVSAPISETAERAIPYIFAASPWPQPLPSPPPPSDMLHLSGEQIARKFFDADFSMAREQVFEMGAQESELGHIINTLGSIFEMSRTLLDDDSSTTVNPHAESGLPIASVVGSPIWAWTPHDVRERQEQWGPPGAVQIGDELHTTRQRTEYRLRGQFNEELVIPFLYDQIDPGFLASVITAISGGVNWFMGGLLNLADSWNQTVGNWSGGAFSINTAPLEVANQMAAALTDPYHVSLILHALNVMSNHFANTNTLRGLAMQDARPLLRFVQDTPAPGRDDIPVQIPIPLPDPGHIDSAHLAYIASWTHLQMMQREYNFYLFHSVEGNMGFFGPALGGNAPVPAAGGWHGPMHFTNARAVAQFYLFRDMNSIMGWLALFMLIGVLLNFLFGLIQRVVTLAVLYMISPLSIAFYPFDDGNSFNNAFVRPFYRQTIAIFAPVMAMNLFFVLLPLFVSIQWFPEDRWVANATASALVMLALFTMLPAIRTQINTLIGGENLQEKGIRQTLKESMNATVGNVSKTAANKIGGAGENFKPWQTTKKIAGTARKYNERRVGAQQLKDNMREQAYAKAGFTNKNGVWVDEAGKAMSAAQKKKYDAATDEEMIRMGMNPNSLAESVMGHGSWIKEKTALGAVMRHGPERDLRIQKEQEEMAKLYKERLGADVKIQDEYTKKAMDTHHHDRGQAQGEERREELNAKAAEGLGKYLGKDGDTKLKAAMDKDPAFAGQLAEAMAKAEKGDQRDLVKLLGEKGLGFAAGELGRFDKDIKSDAG
ncbi:MAG: hypothetical protein FWE31_05895, partial [Firmicutes bacterium]|nr:hypothetical protein [Bacillota bacterium]